MHDGFEYRFGCWFAACCCCLLLVVVGRKLLAHSSPQLQMRQFDRSHCHHPHPSLHVHNSLESSSTNGNSSILSAVFKEMDILAETV